MSNDFYQTSAIRSASLAAWLNSSTRLLEDTNAEAELASEGYRDAVVLELLQNACDAAASQDPSLIVIRMQTGDQPYLEVANSGSPLTTAGVESLSSLRASTKHKDGDTGTASADGPSPSRNQIGRFGVGFAATRAVSDRIDIASRVEGTWQGVRFDRARLRADLHDICQHNGGSADRLVEILRQRDQDLPALRWPCPIENLPADSALHPFEQVRLSEPNDASLQTFVRVWLRGADEVERVQNKVQELDQRVLLAMPIDQLRVEVDGDISLEIDQFDLESNWHIWREEIELEPLDLQELGLAHRQRTTARIRWALPRSGSLDQGQQLVWAPTPTRELLPLPAVLVADFPVNAMREFVLDSAVSRQIARGAGTALANFAADLTRQGRSEIALELWPSAYPPNALASEVFAAAAAHFPRVDVVPTISGAALSGSRACMLPGEFLRDQRFANLAISAGFGHLTSLTAGLSRLTRLGVETVSAADIVEQLPTSEVDWLERYDVLMAHEAALTAADALGSLAVPLADGRVVRGCKGIVRLMAGFEDNRAELAQVTWDDEDLDLLHRFGMRVLLPGAFHPLLERLGAVTLNILDALEGEFGVAVADEILHCFEAGDEAEAGHLSDAVLRWVCAAVPGHQRALSYRRLHLLNLVVEDVTGELAPLRNVCLPGAAALQVFDADWVTEVDGDVLMRHGAAALAWCGATLELPLVDLGELLHTSPHATPYALAAELPEALDDEVVDVRDWVVSVAQKGELPRGLQLVLRDANQVLDAEWPRLVQVIERQNGDDFETCAYIIWWLREEVLAEATLVPTSLEQGQWMADLEACDIGLAVAPAWTERLPRVLWSDLKLTSDLSVALEASSADDIVYALATPPEDFHGEPDVRTIAWLWRVLGQKLAAAEPIEDTPDDIWLLPADGGVEYSTVDRLVITSEPMWLQRTDLGVVHVVPEGLSGLEVTAASLGAQRATELAPGLLHAVEVDGPASSKSLSLEPGHDEKYAVLARVLEMHGVDVRDMPLLKRCSVLTSDGIAIEWWVSTPEKGRPVAYGISNFNLGCAFAWAVGRWSMRYLFHAVLEGEISVTQLNLDAAFDL